MKSSFKLIFTAILVSITSCSEQNSEEKEKVLLKSENKSFSPVNLETSDKYYNLSANSNISKSKIIQKAFIKIESKKLHETKKYLDSIFISNGAYYENEKLNNNKSYYLDVRIPNNQFSNVTNKLNDVNSKTIELNINKEDITEDYYDTETRLESKKKYLIRYYELVSKAKNVEEVLLIEEKIKELEEEIDASKGRINLMDNQIAFSKLTIEIITPEKLFNPKSTNTKSFITQLKKSFLEGYCTIKNIFLNLVSKWPILLFISGFYYLFRRKIKSTISKFRK